MRRPIPSRSNSQSAWTRTASETSAAQAADIWRLSPDGPVLEGEAPEANRDPQAAPLAVKPSDGSSGLRR